MGEVRFLKGTEEWSMFMEFWNLCQKYWIPEKNDKWWEEALGEIDAFQKKKWINGVCQRIVYGADKSSGD